jgi:hypothetical protein
VLRLSLFAARLQRLLGGFRRGVFDLPGDDAVLVGVAAEAYPAAYPLAESSCHAMNAIRPEGR